MSLKNPSRLALILLATLPLAAMGVTIVECKDDDGGMSFRDRCPPGTLKTAEKQVQIDGRRGPGVDDIAKQSPVVLYRTPACDACDIARQQLGKRGVPFTEKDVAQDQANQTELQQLAGSLTVPTVAVGKHVLTGYSSAAIELALDQAGYPPAVAEVASTKGR